MCSKLENGRAAACRVGMYNQTDRDCISAFKDAKWHTQLVRHSHRHIRVNAGESVLARAHSMDGSIAEDQAADRPTTECLVPN